MVGYLTESNSCALFAIYALAKGFSASSCCYVLNSFTISMLIPLTLYGVLRNLINERINTSTVDFFAWSWFSKGLLSVSPVRAVWPAAVLSALLDACWSQYGLKTTISVTTFTLLNHIVQQNMMIDDDDHDEFCKCATKRKVSSFSCQKCVTFVELQSLKVSKAQQ